MQRFTLIRFLLSVALLVVGVGLCLLNSLAHAVVNSGTASRYLTQMKSVPLKDNYTRAEIADSMWQVWTNRLSLPAQSSYTVEELKVALLGSAHVVGSSQHSSDRAGLSLAVRNAAGLEKPAESGMTFTGILLMLVGAFIFGTVVGRRPTVTEHEKAA